MGEGGVANFFQNFVFIIFRSPLISFFQNALGEHPEVDIREMRAVSVTAVMSKMRKTSYIIIKDFGPTGCHSENVKICIN